MNFIMKKQLEMKKGSKKGFTLVEVIVVIVIIAILAAIAVPALTGYIDRAGNRAAVVEARNVGVALQTIASDNTTNIALPTNGNATTAFGTSTFGAEIVTLTGMPATAFTATSLTGINYVNDTLVGFVFITSTGATVTFTTAAGYVVS